MPRPFTAADARRVTDGHNALLADLARAGACDSELRENVRAAAAALADRAVMEVLAGIPVEEINRDKRGFRVKSLRDAGFSTMADLARASEAGLEAVNGISAEGARAIKSLVSSMAAQVREGTRIRLSLDDKSPEATRLAAAVCAYRHALPVCRECRELLGENQQRIGYAISDITAAGGALKWLFASRQKRERAESAYTYLAGLIDGDYGKRSRTALGRLREIRAAGAKRAWSDFEKNPVAFTNVLEDLVPELAGGGESVYGLPEDLAGQVRGETFDPRGLRCELRRYQEWGVRYILHQGRVLLGDEMGLGKTVQAIAVMVSLRNSGATHFAVVCPASVLTNWCREIERMSDLVPVKVHGPGRDGALAEWTEKGGVAVTTYETTTALELPGDLCFSCLVVDEAHYVKNPAARRSAGVRALAAHAGRLLLMTGTALENRVDEMIELVRILDPKLAQELRGMASISAAPRFRRAVAPVYYRRRREDVLTELPDLIESREWCSLGPEEQAAYEAAVLSGNFSRARRVSWDVGDISASSKAERLLELCDEAESEGRKVIVFSFFLETISRVREILGGRCTEAINGSVPPARRQEIIDAFDSAPAGTVLPAQIQSGGTGLNIQSASVVIICEPQFKPSVENQAISRAYRMGQTRNVLVYRLLCEDTVDERIMSLLESKQAVFDAFADESEAARADAEGLDESTFAQIMRQESERIAARRAVPAVPAG